MKQVRGVWLPDGEAHLVPILEKATLVDGFPEYQQDKLRHSLQWVKHWRVAVDAGAHVGLWSVPLAKRFETVHAFEAMPEHQECWRRNVQAPLSVLHCCALGEWEGRVGFTAPQGLNCDARIDMNGSGDIEMKRLDDFELVDVDYLKVDCNGYELPILRGAQRLLQRCKPCVVVEQKPGRSQRFDLPETGAVLFLLGLGAVVRECMNGVYVLSWEGN